MASAPFISCRNKAGKTENAKENVMDTQLDVYEATQGFLEDFEKFKKEIDLKIDANNEMITNSKTKTAFVKKDAIVH
jgi:hypothetical protein